MVRLVLTSALLFVTPGALLFGEAPDELAAGMRVRVTAPTLRQKPLVGSIQRLAEDAIAIAVGDKGQEETLVVPRASVVRLEVSHGRNRRKSALIGAAVVGGAGAVVGAIGCRDSGDFNSQFCGAILGGFGLVVGGLAGGIIGGPERWQALPADRFRLTVAPTTGRGLRVSMKLSF